jgi:glucose/arabinose dehydrogenase
VPAVFADGQGGLFDVAVDPHFSKNGFIYLSYAAGDPQDNRTQVTRAILDGTGLRDLRTIFRSSRGKAGSQHFGGRLLFLPDETLLVSIGDGGNPPASIDGELMRDQAQRLANHFGKVVRITRDGTPAGGGQFGTAPGTQLDLWTIGHRNMQGLALDRRTGQVYASEHGPRGGDEVNALFGGGNFGWPVVTYGVEYSGRTITEARSRSGMRDPLLAWVPSIAPSGLTLYRGTRFPRWQGKLFAGGLVSTDLRVITLNSAGAAVSQESIPIGARVRDVREGPDGFLYLLTDESNGKVLKLADVGGERGQVSAPLEAPR